MSVVHCSLLSHGLRKLRKTILRRLKNERILSASIVTPRIHCECNPPSEIRIRKEKKNNNQKNEWKNKREQQANHKGNRNIKFYKWNVHGNLISLCYAMRMHCTQHTHARVTPLARTILTWTLALYHTIDTNGFQSISLQLFHSPSSSLSLFHSHKHTHRAIVDCD